MQAFGDVTPGQPMSSALLRGRDCHQIGAIDAICEDHVAITLCRGGARKCYHHTDPNEDAALFATGEGGILIAVADGHRGHEGSQLALERLLQAYAAEWTQNPPIPEADWPTRAMACLLDLNDRLLTDPGRGSRELFRTTLAIGLLRPSADRLHFASIGDSHLFLVRPDGAQDLIIEKSTYGFPYYLGDCPETPKSLQEKCVVGSTSLQDTWAVIAVTDGISEEGIGFADAPKTLAEISRSVCNPILGPVELRGESILTLARTITEKAIAVQKRQKSGDNIALAASGIPKPPTSQPT